MAIKALSKSTKGQKLLFLNNKVEIFKIPKTICLKCDDIYSINEHFIESEFLVVRSSAADEDGKFSSSAGEYESILNVPSIDPKKINEAINAVVASYEKKRPVLPDDEIIIQEMVLKTIMSGVIFTHDLNTGAPYYVINYDDQSGLTDTVTSGKSEYSNRTLYIHRNSINQLKSERFIKLLQAVQELEEVMESQILDIEFALDKNLTPYLLQVREITTQTNWNSAVTRRVDATLKGVNAFVNERFKSLNNVYGKTTLLGQMPDWNPVEMIGRAPRALATSLYQALITDYAWSSAREKMGYAIPSGQPLMVTLSGQPFIDTRLSFHSYLPNTLSPKISEKVVNHWLDRLRESPELHDKVEFNIAITSFSFDIDRKMDQLLGDSLTDSEKEIFKKAHLNQTRELIKGEGNGSLKKALDNIQLLCTKQAKQNSSDLHFNISILFSMISDCIQYGTVPFSILARHGFIAKTILLSLKYLGIMSNDEINQFQSSIKTVAGDLVDDMHALQLNKLTNKEFMSRYGHLRPGTYDILSQRYDQMGDISNGIKLPQQEKKIGPFQFSSKQKIQVNKLLKDNNFGNFKADELLNYMREATIGREYGKFVFTRTVSDMLELIANYAEVNELSRDEISHIPLNLILETIKGSDESDIEARLRYISDLEKQKHKISTAIRLPQLLVDQADIYIIPFQVSHPNFITDKKVTAQCLVLNSQTDKSSLKGKVILIEGADPGFDWIFSQNIAGLITKYGGVNSHMAIRCAEFGIPAAIGCGEQRYEKIMKGSQVHLDCAAGLVNLLH